MTDKAMQTNILRLRHKYHSLARRVDNGKSATGAIKLYCRECSGDNHPKDCKVDWCPLWLYRPGGEDTRSPSVPTDAEYAGMVDQEKVDAARLRFGKPAAEVSETEDEAE